MMNGGQIFVGGLVTKSSLNLNGTLLDLKTYNSLMNNLSGFKGCIRDLVIGNHKMNFASDSFFTVNAKPCDLRYLPRFDL